MYIHTLCDDLILYILSFFFEKRDNSRLCVNDTYPYQHIYPVCKQWYTLLRKYQCPWSKIKFSSKVFCYCNQQNAFNFVKYFKVHCERIRCSRKYEIDEPTNNDHTYAPTTYNKKYHQERVYSFHNYAHRDCTTFDMNMIRDIFRDTHITLSHFCCGNSGFMFRISDEK